MPDLQLLPQHTPLLHCKIDQQPHIGLQFITVTLSTLLVKFDVNFFQSNGLEPG